jgi:aminopeptidase N
MARSLSGQQVKGQLADAVTNVLFTYPDENDFDSLGARFENLPFGNKKFMVLQPFANFLKRIKNPANFMKGIDMIVSFRDTIPEQYRPFLNGMILNGIATSKQSKGMTEQADYVKSKLPGNTERLR